MSYDVSNLSDSDIQFTNDELERCSECHVAIIPDEIIPDEIIEIWKRKFGTKEKPHYATICKICGQPAGQHLMKYKCPKGLKANE